MNSHEPDGLAEIDALVQAHLSRQVVQVDAEDGVSRVRAARTPIPRTAVRRRLRLAVGFAAAVVLAFLGGLHIGPRQAAARDLLQETRRVHNLSLERCYVVEIQRTTSEEGRSLLGRVPPEVRVWTRGDRFWVEVKRPGSDTPFVWGREKNGALWAVLDTDRGVRITTEQAPRPLALFADVHSLDVDTLLGEVLQDCTLTEETPPVGTNLTRIVRAEPRSEQTRNWLGRATLEIDGEAKVLRRLVIARNRQGVPFAEVTFTLVETRPADDASYQLEGRLTQPFNIHEGTLEPRVKLELVARMLGTRPLQHRARSPEFRDLEGRVHTPLFQPRQKATVLFFILPDCPIANSYAPEIGRICADYEGKQVSAFVVHADPDVKTEDAKKHAQEYGLRCPVLLDPTHILVRHTGATMAPEAVVLGPDGKVLYRGRIDDWYADYGKRRDKPTRRDLRDALDMVLRGDKVGTPTTPVIGCFLPEPKK